MAYIDRYIHMYKLIASYYFSDTLVLKKLRVKSNLKFIIYEQKIY